MKKLLFACFLVSLLSVATPGCGGDGGGSNTIGGPACGVAPCGGDIVGSWNVSELCLNRSVLMMSFVNALMDSCPQASLGNVVFTPTGALAFNADMTYGIDFTMQGTVGVNLPGACLPSGATCADVSAAIQQAIAGDPTIQSASCAGASSCVCTFVQVPEQIAESGTYTVSGSDLLTTATGQTAPDTLSYCVKETTVTFTMPATATTDPLTAIVATKS